MLRAPAFVLLVSLALTAPLAARDSLGLYYTWGAFTDAQVPRCYAIAMADPSNKQRDYQPYAAIGTWPKKGLRNQVHFRLSRKLAPGKRIVLLIGGERFELTGGGGNAWPRDQRMNAAIVAQMRSASTMSVGAVGAVGGAFSNTWPLAGAASAMDAASIACAKVR